MTESSAVVDTTRMKTKTSLFGLLACVLAACGPPPADVTPSIQFTKVPGSAEGGPNRLEPIEGRVTGARAGQRIVLFARSGGWWVQPLANEPFTAIQPDRTWRNSTHLGTEYAALLVEADYRPPARTDVLPSPGGSVVAVAHGERRGHRRTANATVELQRIRVAGPPGAERPRRRRTSTTRPTPGPTTAAHCTCGLRERRDSGRRPK